MLYWICLLLVLAPLLLERLWLQRGRATVPVRIHVHGTRGKSSITRELAAALDARGMRVLAKTTGDRPEYILPDGTTVPVRRIGPARIQEHVTMLRKAAAMKVDAVVAEGMALQPETVYQSEKILEATHAVIANTRPDHAETMGTGSSGVLETLRHMIPRSGRLFTADEEGADFLETQAAGKGVPCAVVKSPATEQPGVLARAVAEAVVPGIGPARVLESIPISPFSPPVRPGQPRIPVCVYDFLSANDVVSSRLLLERCALCSGFFTVALLATRSDRPLRTRDFTDWILAESRFDAVAAMGSHAGYALLRGLTGRTRHRFLRVRPGLAPDRLLAAMGKKALARGRKGLAVVALGNVHGYGEKWRAAMQHSPAHAPGADRGAKQHEGEKDAD